MKKINLILISVLCLFIGCDINKNEDNGYSDAELIQMIIDADKVDFPLENLPAQSIASLQEDIEYDEMGANMAQSLGYEVELSGNGYRYGHRKEVYFTIEGRRLDPWDLGRGKRGMNGRESKEDWRCFGLVFPITFDMPNGETITVESDDEDGWSDIKSWYDENQDFNERPMMQFPVDITFDDELMTINSNVEMREAYHLCHLEFEDKWGRDLYREDCFEFVYPLNFTMPDGSTMTMEEGEDGWFDIKSWYEDNPGYEEVMPELQFPIDLVYRTEEGMDTQTLNNNDELEDAKEDCRDGWGEESEGEDEECFEYVLPITYVMPDGSTIIVENEEGWYLVRSWYADNGDVEEEPSLQYPVDIVYDSENGEELESINNNEELEAAYEDCRDGWGEESEGEDEECFEYILPITYVMPDGSTIIVENEEGWYLIRSWYGENGEAEEEPILQYPVDIVYDSENGEVTDTINNNEELEVVYESCDDD